MSDTPTTVDQARDIVARHLEGQLELIAGSGGAA